MGRDHHIAGQKVNLLQVLGFKTETFSKKGPGLGHGRQQSSRAFGDMGIHSQGQRRSLVQNEHDLG